MRNLKIYWPSLVLIISLFLSAAVACAAQDGIPSAFVSALDTIGSIHQKLDAFSAFRASREVRLSFMALVVLSPIPIIATFVQIVRLKTKNHTPRNVSERTKFFFLGAIFALFSILCAFAAYFIHADSIYCRACETGNCFSFALFKWFKFSGIGLFAGLTYLSGQIAFSSSKASLSDV